MFYVLLLLALVLILIPDHKYLLFYRWKKNEAQGDNITSAVLCHA